MPLRHLLAGLVSRIFARGVDQRNLARSIAYPFVSHDEAAARWHHRWYHGATANLESPQGMDKKSVG